MEEQDTRELEEHFTSWLCQSGAAMNNDYARYISVQSSSPPSWIFDIPDFNTWPTSTEKNDNFLWLSAPLGFGESVLAAYLTSALAVKFPSSIICTFFYKESGPFCAHDLLRHILLQITEYSTRVRGFVKSNWGLDRSFADLTASAADLFHRLVLPAISVSKADSVYVILDGLNDCPTSALADNIKVIELLR